MDIKVIDKTVADLVKLIEGFKQELRLLNGSTQPTTKDEIEEEFESYFHKQKTVIAAFENDEMVGFSVLKEDGGVFWLDWLYVQAELRGGTCASQLFDACETFANNHGGDRLYVWVHPDNRRMLRFLSKKGYDGLNLVEITKKTKTKGHTVEMIGSVLQY